MSSGLPCQTQVLGLNQAGSELGEYHFPLHYDDDDATVYSMCHQKLTGTQISLLSGIKQKNLSGKRLKTDQHDQFRLVRLTCEGKAVQKGSFAVITQKCNKTANINVKNQSRTGTDGRLQLVGTSAACIKGPNTGSF